MVSANRVISMLLVEDSSKLLKNVMKKLVPMKNAQEIKLHLDYLEVSFNIACKSSL